MGPEYHFRTEWRFGASLDRVWDAIADLESYPAWWSDFRSVRLVAGDGRSAGSLFDCVTQGALPYSLRYRLEVLESEPPRRSLVKSTGDLVGAGQWQLAGAAGGSAAVFFWDVATNKRSLDWLAPLARPLFAYNHDRVMQRGYRALKARLESSPGA